MNSITNWVQAVSAFIQAACAAAIAYLTWQLIQTGRDSNPTAQLTLEASRQQAELDVFPNIHAALKLDGPTIFLNIFNGSKYGAFGTRLSLRFYADDFRLHFINLPLPVGVISSCDITDFFWQVAKPYAESYADQRNKWTGLATVMASGSFLGRGFQSYASQWDVTIRQGVVVEIVKPKGIDQVT